MALTFNGKQKFMLYQLDAITKALKLPQGHFYPYFLAECYNDAGRISSAKAGDFVYGCLRLGKKDLVEQLLNQLFEDSHLSRTLTILFDIAENVYHSDIRQESLTFYNVLIAQEKQPTQQIAIAYYRRFLLVRDQDFRDLGMEALHQLLIYLPQLPITYCPKNQKPETQSVYLQMEAYLEIIKYYHTINDWTKLSTYAHELEKLAKESNHINYLGEARYYQAWSLIGQERYWEAIELIQTYATLNEDWKRRAEYQTCIIHIRMGISELAEAYVSEYEGSEEMFTMLPDTILSYINNGNIQIVSELLEGYKDRIAKHLQASSGLEDEKWMLLFKNARSQYYNAIGEQEKALQDAIAVIDIAERLGVRNQIRSLLLAGEKEEDIPLIHQDQGNVYHPHK